GRGGGNASAAAARQAANGTGTILGDAAAKSDSIANALKQLHDTAKLELATQSGMLASLRNIENTLAGVGNLIARVSGLTTGENLAGALGKTPYRDKIGLALGTAGGVMLGGETLAAVTNLVLRAADKILGPLWGSVNRTVSDAGLSISG